MERSGNFYKAIRLGYILISILIGCMAYNSLYEWQEIEALELGNKKIDEGFEPTTITAYISATSLSKFQIGNETVTIFTHEACPTLTAVCLPNFRVQRYCFLLNFANA